MDMAHTWQHTDAFNEFKLCNRVSYMLTFESLSYWCFNIQKSANIR